MLFEAGQRGQAERREDADALPPAAMKPEPESPGMPGLTV